MQRQQREEERIQGAAMSAAMAQAEALGMTPVSSQRADWVERGRADWEEGKAQGGVEELDQMCLPASLLHSPPLFMPIVFRFYHTHCTF